MFIQNGYGFNINEDLFCVSLINKKTDVLYIAKINFLHLIIRFQFQSRRFGQHLAYNLFKYHKIYAASS